MAGEGLGRQRWQDGRHRQGPRLRDQLPVEDVGQRALHTVVDGAPAADGEIFIVNGAKDVMGMNEIATALKAYRVNTVGSRVFKWANIK